MTIIDKIARSRAPLSSKIVRLFAVVQLNYRQPLGDAAWDKMNQLAGTEQTTALAFLMGVMMGQHGVPKQDCWRELLAPKRRKKK